MVPRYAGIKERGVNMEQPVNKRNISFSPPDISELEIEYMAEAMRSGWITTGPRTKLLEKKLASWFTGETVESTPRTVCLNSATAALELALRLLGIGPQNGGDASDEVITCAYTYSASASVIAHVGAKIVLVDCASAPGTIEMDYDALEEAITEKTKAIIPVDLAGIPCDYDRIFEIVERKKAVFHPTGELQQKIGRVAVVADAAHALGASYKGKMIGTVADFTSFSFHAVKNFTTAEGGALSWNPIQGIDDARIYHQLQLFSLHGQNKDAFAKAQLGAWEYDIIGLWYKCNMTDIAAAMGLAQFERYPGMLERRKAMVEKYDAAMKPLGVEVLDHFRAGRTSSLHLYLARIPGLDRDGTNALIIKLAEQGIATNVHYKPLPMHTAYRNLGFDIRNFPNAYAKFENEVTLPLHTRMNDEDLEWVIRVFSGLVKRQMGDH